ncbi:MAG: YdcF family protein [Planctomycetota bacterium]|nr:YdcF family protein [Planctomycetota bacterium]
MSPLFRHRPELAGTLAEASRAYRRQDDDAFRRLLLAAVELAPERLDIRACLANHYIQTERPDQAVAVYEDVFRFLPTDAGNLFRLAHWRRFGGDEPGAAAALRALRAIRPSLADDLAHIWNRLDAWFAAPVTDAAPPFPESARRPAILVLGYALSMDGEIAPELASRLEKALRAAINWPDAILVASGGVPRAGRVEAAAMREWLEGRGVAPERICEEGYSRDVVENLAYSRHILGGNGNDAVLVVTSAVDVRRAGAGLEIMAGVHGDIWTVRAAASSLDGFRDDGRDRLKAYRDALRAFGMPMMNAYPELAER